jgi:hypothetical protein
MEAADRFLELYLTASGRDGYDPYWDVVAALGGIEQNASWAPDAERFLAQVLCR